MRRRHQHRMQQRDGICRASSDTHCVSNEQEASGEQARPADAAEPRVSPKGCQLGSRDISWDPPVYRNMLRCLS